MKKQAGCNSKCAVGSSRETFYYVALDRRCTQSMQIAEVGREYTPDFDGNVGSVSFLRRQPLRCPYTGPEPGAKGFEATVSPRERGVNPIGPNDPFDTKFGYRGTLPRSACETTSGSCQIE